jgi:hypothetical protein
MFSWFQVLSLSELTHQMNTAKVAKEEKRRGPVSHET